MSDYTIANLGQDDIPLLNSIKPGDWPSIAEIHAHYLQNGSCECAKAISADGELSGIGTGIAFGKTGWLAHIIVSEKHQRKGLGRTIAQNRVDVLREARGCETVTLTATDQGYPVYKKIGFAEESRYRILTRAQAPGDEGVGSERIRKIGDRHLEEVFSIDRLVSGEDRARFLRPVMDRGFVYERDGKVLGFYLPGFGDGGISAIAEEAGLALLGMRIREDKKIFIPEENGIAYDFLLSNGYSEAKKIWRMILGKPFARKPEYCYSRIGGFAG